jgi:type II secretory pathway component PulK
MWGWSSDALSFFVSKKANNWRERFDFLQLLALFNTMNETASENLSYVTTEYFYTIIHFLMLV